MSLQAGELDGVTRCRSCVRVRTHRKIQKTYDLTSGGRGIGRAKILGTIRTSAGTSEQMPILQFSPTSFWYESAE